VYALEKKTTFQNFRFHKLLQKIAKAAEYLYALFDHSGGFTAEGIPSFFVVCRKDV